MASQGHQGGPWGRDDGEPTATTVHAVDGPLELQAATFIDRRDGVFPHTSAFLSIHTLDKRKRRENVNSMD